VRAGGADITFGDVIAVGQGTAYPMDVCSTLGYV
jgi:hypothetical protein